MYVIKRNKQKKEVIKMTGTYYGNSSNGYGYSPDRSRDVDRFNESTKSNYTYFDPCATYYGNSSTGFGCSYGSTRSNKW